ncbi:MAG TPA: hypothetical protein VFJ85_10965 [Acidimicrobiales bacterium]|nr:hypothetical protein [Acidimicrobiales bacterium]
MTRRRLVAVWLAAALAFGAALAVAQGTRGPLDDPDPALQRPGFLDQGDLPAAAPPVTAGVPAAGQRAVVFFERPAMLAELCRALRRQPVARADVVVVVPAAAGGCGVPVVVDAGGALRRAYGLRSPRDGGPGVGYAVVDRGGRIRYRTLDPSVAANLHEVETILDAT